MAVGYDLTKVYREELFCLFEEFVDGVRLGKCLGHDSVVGVQLHTVDLRLSAILEAGSGTHIGDLFKLLQRLAKSRDIHDLPCVSCCIAGSRRLLTYSIVLDQL